MNSGTPDLPNYFLADLPAEATLNAEIIGEACRTLKRNRERYLAVRPTSSLISVLSESGVNWLRPDYPHRKRVMEQGPAATGFSAQTLARGLDAFFSQLSAENLKRLVALDLGDHRRLEQVVEDGVEQAGAGRVLSGIVTGPELIAQIGAGNVPNPTLTLMVLGVLMRSAQFVKCASGGSFLPRLFAHSLYEMDPKLGACLEIAEWRGGDASLESALFDAADCVIATGSDETLASIQRRLAPRTRFVGYGHRVSFAYVTAAALSGAWLRTTAERAAADVTAWNQLGCLSPHVIYVEQGGLAVELFAERLAEELARREELEPRGTLPKADAAAIASRRAMYEVRAAHSPDTRLWQSPNSTAWTVVYESDPRFQLSCLNRFVYVKSVADLKMALQSAESVRGQVSTVGLAAPNGPSQDLILQLARWGATRICPLGEMQRPPLTWRHDGRPALGELVTWTDVEH